MNCFQGKNQAFLELAEESAAIAMVAYFTNCVAQLRGRSVYVQFSTHKELKTDQSHSNANSAAQVGWRAIFFKLKMASYISFLNNV